MPLITRILAPVDFSAPSHQSAAYADRLASRLGAGLTLLHLVEPVAFDYAMVGPSQALLQELMAARMERGRELLTRIATTSGDVRRDVAWGDPAQEILRHAHEDRRSLIVMSTHGAGTIQRMLGIGSVTLQVLGGAECPVLTSTHLEGPPHLDGGRILCAVDLDAAAEQALRWAHELAIEFRARMTVVHALRLTDSRDIVDGHWVSTLRERLKGRFEELLRAQRIDADLLIQEGSPHEVVANAARALQAACVVVGRSTAHDALGRLRASTFDIIRRTPCPVVSV